MVRRTRSRVRASLHRRGRLWRARRMTREQVYAQTREALTWPVGSRDFDAIGARWAKLKLHRRLRRY